MGRYATGAGCRIVALSKKIGFESPWGAGRGALKLEAGVVHVYLGHGEVREWQNFIHSINFYCGGLDLAPLSTL